ncbi:MAG: transglutaminase family protein [Leptospiraceae bacterium]|nr:transglutaminase family protein [Leptospiraceae bacterium]
MPIKVALHHLTHYRFDRPVQIHPHSIRLRPAPHSRSSILSYSLKVNPEHFINWQQDPTGNFLARLVFPQRAWELRIQVDLVVELHTINPFDFFLEPEANTYPFDYPAEMEADLAIYRSPADQSDELTAWVKEIQETVIQPGITTVDFLVNVNAFVANRVGYIIRMEPGIQDCAHTIRSAKGSCRDSAVLLMHLLRRLGLASRFCSGYLIQLKADEKPRTGPAGPSEDFTDLHAWTEVYLPGAGWVGLDPTSGLLTGEGHIPLFCSAIPSMAAPVTGATDRCESTLHFEMSVQRIAESPRTTRPYSDSQWDSFQKLVPSLDERLKELDMRLTMGGEPTFVSDENLEGAEWNYAAMAPGGDKEKRRYALQLRDLLSEQFGLNGPFYLSGQGKWYPGEPLPRWAYYSVWRTDGHPLALSRPEKGRPAEPSDAMNLLSALCKRLGLDQEFAQDLYEDPLALIRTESGLPEDLKEYTELEDFSSLERNRALRLLEKDLSISTAAVLPIAYEPMFKRWSSSLWKTRRSRIFLFAGDSPAGLRLPLGSLGSGMRSVHMEDPTELTANLPDPDSLRSYRGKYTLKDDAGRDPLHVALVADVRNKTLYVFLPPPSSVESQLSLIAHLEACLEELDVEFEWEGHPPPAHPALQHLSITPDPGVIEVNLQPSRSLAEACNITETLYRAAKDVGLTTQKFLIDGRPAATGGGNHVTLGANRTLESPFLRFPGLLPALLVYWQRHPALSYLFSGLFIGPTSQAPRVDEARIDTLYDLEIALQELYGLDEKDSELRPYMIDRLLRHHLVDLTGNTHRAEFCIDKLFDPGSLGGRRGLLEMRAFEMPPHWKMSCVQQGLILAILCMMRTDPPSPELVRWGIDLRDRFMLPYYIRQDLQEVLDDVTAEGFDFSMDLFEPFFEFRFPLYGEVEYGGVKLQLRMALEPWNVLGEEAVAGTTSRAVDSAVERMQIELMGDVAGRYRISCNGFEVPMQQVASDRAIGGVRFKAWNPASTMHPHIKAHSPLLFSLFDTFNEKYVAGCSYHISHPGGRSYDTLPVNALEAESRRISRFSGDYCPKENTPPIAFSNPEFPCTLDLRLAEVLHPSFTDH